MGGRAKKKKKGEKKFNDLFMANLVLIWSGLVWGRLGVDAMTLDDR